MTALAFDELARLTAGCNGNPAHIACPVCGPQRRSPANRRRPVLAVWTTKPDFLSYSCARCGLAGWARASGGSTVYRHALEREHAEYARQGRADAEKNRRRALELWREAAPIAGTLAETYLASRRIFELPPGIDEVLRFHPRCAFGGERHPCMLALMRDAITDAPRGIQRTALTADGKKIGRRTLGRKSGAAVKLWPDADVSQGLVIGEGLETVISAAMRIEHHGTLLRPAWAVVDAGNMASFPILDGLGALTLLVDRDAAGQEAAQACARRWRAAGREVTRLVPRQLGTDFNDIVKKADAA